MTTFLVERRLPGLSRQHLAMVQRSLQTVAEAAGIGYLRSIWVPAHARCLCVFEADSIEAVTRDTINAQFTFVTETESLHLPAPACEPPRRSGDRRVAGPEVERGP